MADDNTTGHVWDVDLREMNNPLPRWWLWLFVITVIFAGVYLALYPGLGKFPGTLNWTSVGQYEAEQQRAQQNMAPIFAKFSGKSAEELAKDSAGHGHRRAPVRQQLRAVPRLRRARQQGLPEPDRQRLALRRRAEPRSPRPSPRAASA